jgi:thymidine kinase
MDFNYRMGEVIYLVINIIKGDEIMPHFTFVFSAMGGTKTRELLSTDYNFRVDCLLDSYVIKPSRDTRDGYDVVRSRDGGERQVNLVAFPETNVFIEVEKSMPDIVLVDEVQFMSKQQIIQLKDIKDKLKIPIIAYGLKNDFQNEMFEGTTYAFLYADKFKQIKTVCRLCKNTATMNMRLLNGSPIFKGEQVQVGGNESYMSVCSECYDKCKDKVARGEL